VLILITGATSGFGKLTVPLLLEKGHTVLAGVRGGMESSESRLAATFPTELQRYAGRLHAIDLDLKSASSIASAAQLIQARFEGKLDVLVNNAGFGLMGILEDQTEAQIREQMEVNFFGTVFLTRALLPAIREARGKILSVSSIAGMVGFPFYSAYCASKFALEGFMESLRYDLKPFGVQVAMIEPGGFKTGFVSAKQFGEKSADHASPYFKRTQGFIRLFDKTSESRLGDPVTVARLISRLCDARKLRFHHWIGGDAWVVRLMRFLFPDQTRLVLIEKGFEWALRKEI